MWLLNGIRKNGDVGLAVGVFGIIAILMVPLPPLLVDVFLALSITVSLLVFLVALYVRRPVEFSAFPIILLITTIFRLSLNVASTRLILLHGDEGTDAAGHVIEAFGNFVVGGNYVVGFIVFCILLVINFMVVTKGAGRVAEVAARFTLDALPGKQMAIDGELNSGLIDEKEARRRRAAVAQEADFYGAMDGASKFIKGDAVAAIIIMVINIVAGIVIGVVMEGLDFATAATNYTLLTIGDGLASQVPALIVSAAAGLLVTRVSDLEDKPLEDQFGAQMLGNPRVLAVLAGLSCGFVFIPGLRIPFSIITVVLGALAYTMNKAAVVKPARAADGTEVPAGPTESRPEDLLRVEPLVVEVGLDLVHLVDEKRGGALVERIQRIRRQIVTDLGVLLPAVHLRDNVRLGAGQYRVLLRGDAIGSGKVVARQVLALDPGTATTPLQGTPGVDPVYGLKGWWIGENQRLRAQAQGYTVVDVPTVLTTHLDDLFRRHAHEIYGRRQLADALERVGADNPRLVEELVPDPLPRASVLRVFRNLIQEGVGVRDVQAVLEALAEYAPRTRDADVLTEFVRQRMARAVTARFLGDDGALHYVGLGADAEDAVLRGLQGGDGGVMTLVLEPDTTRKLIVGMRQLAEGWNGSGELVLLVPPLARGPLRRLLEKAIPRVPVLSPGEIVPGTALAREAELSLASERPGDRAAEKKGLKSAAS
ncbi:MAG: flagellar biosynthesis protein FlhA [Pseudomonadota bacterium]|nr:flagellar biosynthesis protein FlhA [Pseudomonadota bacterium]